jgi:hypothetical protein
MSAATIRSSLLALAAALELACSTTVSRDDADVSDSATGQRDSSLVSPDGGGTDAPMKQARAYGVGIVLATQNPMDLEYRALSYAGTWFLGRLQTDADRSRDHGRPRREREEE